MLIGRINEENYYPLVLRSFTQSLINHDFCLLYMTAPRNQVPNCHICLDTISVIFIRLPNFQLPNCPLQMENYQFVSKQNGVTKIPPVRKHISWYIKLDGPNMLLIEIYISKDIYLVNSSFKGEHRIMGGNPRVIWPRHDRICIMQDRPSVNSKLSV